MSHIVGPKGQVVIEKEIRDRLGVRSGWRTLQLLVEDHVEIRFLPPEHGRSLAGSLARYAMRSLPTADSLRKARDEAWTRAAERRAEDPKESE